MQVRATIFDSANEQELFHALHGTWEPGHRVYPHLPFTNLIEINQHRLSADELNYLHKTTVDYVLTTAKGMPLLAIEFDGLGRGARRKGSYVQRVATKADPHRALKLGLKCRVADEAGFPFCVVSYEEKEVVDGEANLVIAHGIVGGFLAHGYASRLMQEFYEEEREHIESLPENEQWEYVQNYIVISAEVEAEMTMNPIAKRAAELAGECGRLAVVGGTCESWPDEEPPPPEADVGNPEWDMAARIAWLDGRRRVGATTGVETCYGRVERTAWVRNIDFPGTTALSIASEISELLAWQDALRLVKEAIAERREPRPLPTIIVGSSPRELPPELP
jgi:hypothetical protein